jgi:hypothetical protein
VIEIFTHLNSKNSLLVRENICQMFASWKKIMASQFPKGFYRNEAAGAGRQGPLGPGRNYLLGLSTLFSFSSAFFKSMH